MLFWTTWSDMANILAHTTFHANIFIGDWDITQNLVQNGDRRHLKFPEIVPFCTTCDPWMAHIYRHSKFGANRSRTGRDTPFCVFYKMAAAAVLNFQKVLFRTPCDLCIVHIYTVSQKGSYVWTLCNFVLTDFQNFCTAGKRMKFATKHIWQYPPHLRYVTTLPWEKVNFWRYSADMQENANKVWYFRYLKYGVYLHTDCK